MYKQSAKLTAEALASLAGCVGKAVQPVKEIYQHFQNVLLVHFHHFPLFLHHWIALEPEKPLLGRDRVFEEELKSAFENTSDNIVGEVRI